MLFASAAGASSGNGGNFLIPNGTFVVELVIFLVVLGVIAKWILPPLQEVAERARRRILRCACSRPRQARAEAQGVLDRARPGAGRGEVAGPRHHRPRQPGRRRGPGAGPCAGPGGVRATGRGLPRGDRRRRPAELVEELVGRLDTLVAAAAERVLGSRVDPASHRALIDEAVAAAAGAASVRGAV